MSRGGTFSAVTSSYCSHIHKLQIWQKKILPSLLMMTSISYGDFFTPIAVLLCTMYAHAGVAGQCCPEKSQLGPQA
jgi:hypothetical protein